MRLYILMYALSSVLFVLANEGPNENKINTDDDKNEKEEENVISESQTVENIDDLPETDEAVPISKLKVVQDNVSGNKHDSFSEDQNNNRDDEQTVSDIRKEAENRVLEKDKKAEENLISGHSSENEKLENTETNDMVDNEKYLEDSAKQKSDHDDADNTNIHVTDNTGSDPTKTVPEQEKTIGDNPKPQQEAEDTDNTDPSVLDRQVPKPPIDAGVTEDGEPSASELNLDTDSDLLDVHTDDIVTSGGRPQTEFEGNEADASTYNSGGNEEIHSETHDSDKASTIGDKEELSVEENFEEKTVPLKGKTQSLERSEEAAELYKEAKSLGRSEKKRTNKLLLAASELGHTEAMEDIAYSLLFGDEIKANETKAYEYFRQLAEGGSPKGQQGLGFIFGTGLHRNSSQAKALIYTTFAALGGDTMAEMMLGFRHYGGTGVTKSCETALTYYKKVAKKVADTVTSNIGGNTVQRVRLYDELEQPGGNNGQIDEDLLQYYQFLADKGDTQAQIGLGQLYFQGGRGVDINYERAFHYFKLAAETGNGNGLAYIGKMYLQGLHVDKNPEQARKNFEASMKNKNPIGQAGLGMLYLKGEGGEKDYDKALKYFSQSAEQGWVEGQLQLGNMYYNGIGVKKDYRQAVKYFTFASQSGHVLAFYNLAMMHTIGAGVVRSCTAATELFKNVAERGNWSMMFMDAYDSYKNGDIRTALMKYYFLAELGYEVAQSNVAYILDKGDVSFFEKNQTYARALLQWSRAADQGYAVARVKVGDYHFYGLGTKVNYEVAALHYRLASEKQGNAQALFNLGYMHEQGFGLKKDIHLAKRFYDMAAEASVDAQFPVYLALLKLAVEFGMEWLGKNYRFWENVDTNKIQLIVMQNMGPDWDIYLIAVLTGMLGILLLYRRDLRQNR